MSSSNFFDKYSLSYDSGLERVKDHLKHDSGTKGLFSEAEAHHYGYFRYKGEKYKIVHDGGGNFHLKEDHF